MGRMGRDADAEVIRSIIQKEIQSISSLNERIAFKELMEGVFLSLYEVNQQMYKDLEERVQAELSYGGNGYQVSTGIIEREFFDSTHHFFSPILEKDLTADKPNVKDVRQAIKEKGAYSFKSVMFCCDYLEIKKLLEKEASFEGVLRTEKAEKEWKVQVCLRENGEYLKEIAYLYHLFVRNGIPWQTVNAPYLYKMADVVVTELPEEIGSNEVVDGISVDFGECARIIREDMVPVWNIQKLTLDSIGFPTPCGDHVNFEHNVSLRAYGADNAYLVEDDRAIQSVSQNGEKLRIISESSEAKRWTVYMLRSAKDRRIDRYTFPIMHNVRRDSFGAEYQRRWGRNIRTKTELAHFIKGYGMEDYVQYQDCEIADGFLGVRETYSLNPFIVEEIRNAKSKSKLVLYFRRGQKEAWLQRDILSFLVSEVQRIYPEYDCGGVIL